MRKGEQTRQEIVEKAAAMFNLREYEGAALSDLMKPTGLEKGGIYRHFDSKQQLAAEAFDYAWNLALDTDFEGTQGIANTVDRLKQGIRNFRNRSAGLVIGGCPLLNTAIDSDDGNPQLREKARHALNSWLGRLESIIEEGQGRAEIRRYVEPSELATLIVGTLEGSLMMSRLQGKEQPRDWACRNLEDYLENNVRAKGLKGRGRKS